MFVFKEAALHPRLMSAILSGSEVKKVGVLHWSNAALPEIHGVELHHVYEPPLSHFSSLNRYRTVSLSSRFLLRELKRTLAGKTPSLRICLECGDTRDGVLPEELPEFCTECHALGFHLDGLMLNFACLSTNAPDEAALALGADALATVRRFWPEAGLSVGGTDILEFAEQHPFPEGINEIRCGTGVMLGVYPLTGRAIPGATTDTFELEGCLLEKRWKNGRLLALFDFGSYHTAPEKLIPPMPGMTHYGHSSAYTVFDISECIIPVAEGALLRFHLRYESLSRALTSRALPLCEIDHA